MEAALREGCRIFQMKEWQKAAIRKGIESNSTFIESIGDFDELDIFVYFADGTDCQLFDYKVDPEDRSKAIFVSPSGMEYRTLEHLKSDGFEGFDVVIRRHINISKEI